MLVLLRYRIEWIYNEPLNVFDTINGESILFQLINTNSTKKNRSIFTRKQDVSERK